METYKLPSVKLYEYFTQKNVNTDSYDETCDMLKRRFPGLSDIYDLCRKLLFNVETSFNEEEEEKFQNYRCTYLHYWLNDKVINTFNLYDDGLYLGILLNLYRTWNKFVNTLTSAKFRCKPDMITYISRNINVFKFKEMYDYFYNYEEFNRNTSYNPNECNEICEYLTDIIANFESFKTECSRNRNKCLQINNFFELYDPQNLIDKFKCNAEKLCMTAPVAVKADESPPEQGKSLSIPVKENVNDFLTTQPTIITYHNVMSFVIVPLGLVIIFFTLYKYEFFEKIDKNYIYNAVKSLNYSETEDLSAENSFINCDIQLMGEKEKRVCRKLNSLISTLCSNNSQSPKNYIFSNHDIEYLKFWVNFEIKNEGLIGNGDIEDLSGIIKEQMSECCSKDTMKNILIFIDPQDLNRMKILNNLYKNYNEMHEIIFSTSSEGIQKCLEYSKQCVTEYNGAIKQYRNVNDYFYNALKNFENYYKKLYADALGKNKHFEKYIEKIPRQYQISELSFYSIEYERNKIIFISLLGSVFVFIVVLIYIYMVKKIITL
ncbi:hypothetical protein PVBG_00623 [Plasmodium vivax Brazil I]|uniref:Uncharacterized protein n=1 Tax=Plasmodium vivax (strain Brazil I) TaxID=1033975 RepID=A0A0J9VBL5_PLAV1|nr:hypothetical protein PVBG_00623 [Plasmodium vivax Brazil I]